MSAIFTRQDHEFIHILQLMPNGFVYNVHTNTECVRCISLVYSSYPYEYNQ